MLAAFALHATGLDSPGPNQPEQDTASADVLAQTAKLDADPRRAPSALDTQGALASVNSPLNSTLNSTCSSEASDSGNVSPSSACQTCEDGLDGLEELGGAEHKEVHAPSDFDLDLDLDLDLDPGTGTFSLKQDCTHRPLAVSFVSFPDSTPGLLSPESLACDVASPAPCASPPVPLSAQPTMAATATTAAPAVHATHHDDPPDAALLGTLQTEGVDSTWADRIDTLDAAALCAEFVNHESAVLPAIRESLPVVGALVEALVARVQAGGRVLYVGAGNSGRVACMDSTELPPTFSADATQFKALVAGDATQQTREDSEGAEDSADDGAAALAALHPTALDSVIGISASGRTPYVLGALKLARTAGALTAGITNCHPSAFGRLGLQYLVTALTGPEFVSGSTRLKAGTAAKQILNMVSTCLMVRLGKTYRGLMLDVRVCNNKLRVRGRRIVRSVCGPGAAYVLGCAGQTEPQYVERLASVSDAVVDAHIQACDSSVKLACAVAMSGLDLASARARLDGVHGHFYRFLQQTPAAEVVDVDDVWSRDLVLVIDGGGTRCKVAVAAPDGPVAHAETGACNINCSTPDELVSQVHAATLLALGQLRDAALPGHTHALGPVAMPRFARVWAGIAGLHYSFNPGALTSRLETVLSVSVADGTLRLTSDSILQGACIGADDDVEGGLAVLAGTGSVAVAFRKAPGTHEVEYQGRVGGWGYLLGDQGSAFDVGKRAIQAVLVDMEVRGDGSGEGSVCPSALETAVLAALGHSADAGRPEDVLPRVLHHEGRAPKNQIAQVARVVTALAFPASGSGSGSGPGDAQALGILQDAAGAYVDHIRPLALSAKCRPASDALVLSGAMLCLAPYRALFLDAWQRKGLPAFKKTVAVDRVADWAIQYLRKEVSRAPEA